MLTELNDIKSASAIDIIDDTEPKSNKVYSSAMTEGRISTEVGIFESKVNNLETKVEQIDGVIIFRGIMETDSLDDLSAQLTNYIQEQLQREPNSGDLVKVYLDGQFNSSYLYGDDWQRYSDSDDKIVMEDNPQTITNKTIEAKDNELNIFIDVEKIEDVTSPKSGVIYHDTTSDKYFVWNGTKWGTIGGDESQYTYVVDSDQKLVDWFKNTSGNDYSNVLVKAGTWYITKTGTSGTRTALANFQNSKTQYVTCEDGAYIDVTLNIAGYKDGIQGMTTVDGVSISENTNKTLYKNMHIIIHSEDNTQPLEGVFKGMYNMYNCSVTSDSMMNGYAYNNCHNLVNCTANLTCPNEWKGTTPGHSGAYWHTTGFNGCYYIDNCHVIINNIWSPHDKCSFYGFISSYNMNNCSVHIDGDNSLDHSLLSQCYGFYSCGRSGNLESMIGNSKAQNIYIDDNTYPKVVDFCSCSDMTNLTSRSVINGSQSFLAGCNDITNTYFQNVTTIKETDQHIAPPSTVTAIIFNKCSRISNCFAVVKAQFCGSSTVKLVGFEQCKSISNSEIRMSLSALKDNPVGTLIMANGCEGMTNNVVSGTLVTENLSEGSASKGYVGCIGAIANRVGAVSGYSPLQTNVDGSYADYGNLYQVDNTPNGGFNQV